jgi:cell division septal protein FtsQ
MSKRANLTRADVVRQRRLRPKKKKGPSRVHQRDLPPITARGVVNESAISQRKKTDKRRFKAVFNPARAQIALRPKPQRRVRIGWRLVSLSLILLLGPGIYFAWTRPELRVHSAQVSGNTRIAADEITSVLGLNGSPVFLLRPEQMETQVLENFPELLSVNVSVALPNHVTLEVVEREPVVLWQQDGNYTWIDENGFAFRPRGEAGGLVVVQALSAPPELVAAEENQPTPFITEDLVRALLSLSIYVPAGTPILYHPSTGLSLSDARGWQAVFGKDADDMASKVSVYQAMVAWLDQRGIQPVLIDVTYPNAPYYRLDRSLAEEQ